MNVCAYRQARVALDPEGGGREVVGELEPVMVPDPGLIGNSVHRPSSALLVALSAVLMASVAPFVYTLLPLPPALSNPIVFLSLAITLNLMQGMLHLSPLRSTLDLMDRVDARVGLHCGTGFHLFEIAARLPNWGPLIAAPAIDLALGTPKFLGSWTFAVGVTTTISCVVVLLLVLTSRLLFGDRVR